MKRLTHLPMLVLMLIAVPAQSAQVQPEIKGVRGHIYSEKQGFIDYRTDIFDPSALLYNVSGAAVFLVVDVDLGPACKMPAKVPEGQAFARPKQCLAAPGSLQIRTRLGSGPWSVQRLPLKNFFPAEDGHVRVPALAYRAGMCLPMDFESQLVGAGKPSSVVQRIDFHCAE